MHVCVLGAGIAGLSTAYLLNKAGHSVTVLERASVAAGASGGNGGQLSYSYVQPLADPGIWKQLPRLLLSPSSPLTVRPSIDVKQWRWVLSFMRACTTTRSVMTTAHLLDLAASSRELFEEILKAEKLACNFTRTGKLVIYGDNASFEAGKRQLSLQRDLGGAPQQAVTRDQAIDIEPALARSQRSFVGGIYTASECAADCRLVCEELFKLLQARGTRFLLETTASAFALRGKTIVAARTDMGDVFADAFVLATGAASAQLARSVGIRIPLYPLKGYSVTLDIKRAEAAPKVSITDSARKVVFAQIGRQLRVAGMAELVGTDESIPPSRIRALTKATESLFPGACQLGMPRPWTGMRPATPDGLPIVGRHPSGPRNLILNTGHGALGFTLAFATAAQVAALLKDFDVASARLAVPVALRA
jgi:D-amino-acid dehydrogenase